MNLFGMLEISGSGMTAERQRAQVVVSNMANAQTTHTAEGGPYKRQLTVFHAVRRPAFPIMTLAGGFREPAFAGQEVRISQVVADRRPPVLRYEPGNPNADTHGYVAYPAIDPVEEMTDLLGAVRAYEMNASAVQATKNMIQQSLEILK